jgi:hypothetical protein
VTTRSSEVSTYFLTPDHLSLVPATVAHSGSRQLVSARSLYRNGRDVIGVLLFRPLVNIFAALQTACLRHGKGARKAKGRGDYHSRSMTGMAGELALHFLAKMLGLDARIMLPSLASQSIDHLITVGSRVLAIQSKTSKAPPGYTVSKIYGRFKFAVDAARDVDYYSFAVMEDEQLHAESDYVTVYLFAFAPRSLVQERADIDGLERYITYATLQAATDSLSHLTLDERCILPASLSISRGSFDALTSPNIEDRFLEALDLLESPVDASRALDMTLGDSRVHTAFEAALNQRLRSRRRPDAEPRARDTTSTIRESLCSPSPGDRPRVGTFP